MLRPILNAGGFVVLGVAVAVVVRYLYTLQKFRVAYESAERALKGMEQSKSSAEYQMWQDQAEASVAEMERYT